MNFPSKHSVYIYYSDLGCHIDGFIAQAAHTVVVGKDKSTGAEGRKAEVILAAYNALQASLRHLRPGSKNYDVRRALSTENRPIYILV